MMNDLKTTTALVKSILEQDGRTRNSDSFLYLKVLEHVGAEKGIHIHGLTVPDFLVSMDTLGLPGFETVRRTRQKVQQHYPELASAERVAALRAVNEAAFREYARGAVD